ncbi:hypothetical protein SLE2022_063600 [Rubroshorea leprosula]
MFEVLEVSWLDFSNEVEIAKDLDDLLVAHYEYLHSIVEKSLLGERSQNLYKPLFVLFDLILQFRSHADRLYEGIHDLQARTAGSSLPSRAKSKSRKQTVGSIKKTDSNQHKTQEKNPEKHVKDEGNDIN